MSSGAEPRIVEGLDPEEREAGPAPVEGSDLEELEVSLLLEGVYRRYGADFRDYARTSLTRRLRNMMREEGAGTLSELQARVLHETEVMERLLLHLSVNVTAMYRDPSFYVAFREKVVPQLRSFPYVRLWHAGCSTGEEVYSTAILLSEEGIFDRCRIYATDMNAAVLERAKAGIFSLANMREYTANYLKAGGKAQFSDYYTANYDHAIFKRDLKRNVVFSQHNLVTDASFNEFNVILCRNVMIYFNASLQERCHRLFFTSLRRFGILCLGRRETIAHTVHEQDFDVFDERERIYRRQG